MKFYKSLLVVGEKFTLRHVVYVSIFLLVFGGLFAFTWGCEARSSKEVAPILEEIAADMNKNCPVMLSESLRSDKVEAKENNLILYYSLIKEDVDVIDNTGLLSKVENNIVPTICNIEVWRKVLQKGALFNLKYYDKNGKTIGNIIISDNKCLVYEQSGKMK
jgi:hypothetical protein